LTVDRSEAGSQFNLTSSGTLEVNGETEVAAGEVTNGTLDSDGTGDTLGPDNDSDVLVGGTLSSDLEAEGNVRLDGDGGSVSSVTFNGQGTQSFDGSSTVSADAFTLDQEPPASGDASTVSVNDGNGVLDLTDSDGDLTLNGGLLVADEVRLDAEGNTNTDPSAVRRDPTAGEFENDFSHVVAALERTAQRNSGGNLERVNYPVGTESPVKFRRYRLDFPDGGPPLTTDITVEYRDEKPSGTAGFPLTDDADPPVTIGADVPNFQWRVTSDEDLTLNQGEYQVTVLTSDQDLENVESNDLDDYRLVVRSQADDPSNASWDIVGNGKQYRNDGPFNNDITIRTEGAGADITELGTVVAVGVPADAEPSIVTNNGQTVPVGQGTSIESGDLEVTDDKDGPADLTYTVTKEPSQGELLLSGNAVGENGTFTQKDINDGNLAYNHTAGVADDDNFEFDVEDQTGQTTSGTFNVGVQAAPTIATNGGASLTQGNQTPIQTGDLEATDADNAPSELTYTVTTAPTQGELLLSGSALGQGGTFTQEAINDGNLAYNHTAGATDNDNFEFKVADPDGNEVTGQTFNVTVDAAQFAISGTVVHPRTDGNGDPVDGATVTITDANGNAIASPTTDAQGSYSASVTEGDYTVQVTSVQGVPNTPQDGGLAADLSVNVSDAFQAQQNFLGDITLSGARKTVGDVDDNGSVNTTDAFAIQSYFLDSNGDDNDPDYPFSAVGVLFGEEASVTVSGADETADLSAVAYGDINLSGDLNGAAGSGSQTTALSASTSGEADVALPKSGTDVESAATTAPAAEDAETTFEMPVRLDRSAEIGAFNLAMTYDSEKVTFQGASAPSADIRASSEDGTVRLAWFDQESGQNPLAVEDGEALVTLTFKADADVKRGDTFELKDVQGELTGADAETLSGVGLSVPQVSFGIERPDKFALEGNAPNPFRNRTALSVQMPESGSATVRVYNTLGQQVKTLRTNLSVGDQRIEVDGSGLSSGVYMYRIEVEMGSKTVQRSGRMTLVK